LTIDEDIAKRLHAESRRTGRAFKTVVNDYLRAGLAHREEVKAAARFKVEPFLVKPDLQAVAHL
jgi:hypothetical protein